MLKLHHDMVTYNTLGVGKHIISIFDGDVKGNIAKQEEYKQLPKCFLPIPSVEKSGAGNDHCRSCNLYTCF